MNFLVKGKDFPNRTDYEIKDECTDLGQVVPFTVGQLSHLHSLFLLFVDKERNHVIQI